MDARGLGALGSYTTFSTLALERLEQLADGRVGSGLLNAFGQLTIGLAAAYLEVIVVRGFQGIGVSI